MTAGNNPNTDRSKQGQAKRFLTDKNGVPLSIVITSSSTHDIKAVTDVMDYAVAKRPNSLYIQMKEDQEEESITSI